MGRQGHCSPEVEMMASLSLGLTAGLGSCLSLSPFCRKVSGGSGR